MIFADARLCNKADLATVADPRKLIFVNGNAMMISSGCPAGCHRLCASSTASDRRDCDSGRRSVIVRHSKSDVLVALGGDQAEIADRMHEST